MNSKPVRLILSLLMPLLVGAIAGYFTVSSVHGWFETLNAPSFRPPNWVFGPVWTTLYVLMGISFYMISIQPQSNVRKYAINLFYIQLLLNFFWSFLFFYFHIINVALIDIILLWISILTMITRFHKVKPLAAYINIPYLLWVTFALILNAAYCKLN